MSIQNIIVKREIEEFQGEVYLRFEYERYGKEDYLTFRTDGHTGTELHNYIKEYAGSIFAKAAREQYFC